MTLVFHIKYECDKAFSQMVNALTHCEKKNNQRVIASKRYLGCVKCCKADSFMRYVTKDEIWIRHYGPEVKEPGESCAQ